MSCFFCKSPFHISQNCKIYSSNESRKKFANKYNYCRICFISLNVPHNDDICKMNRKCYTCFTVAHHTSLCVRRGRGWNFFIPNIDKIAFQRLLKMFDDPLEQYTLAFLSPETYDLIPLKPLKVIHRKHIENADFTKEFPDSTILINGVLSLSDVIHYESFLKTVICKPYDIKLERAIICTDDVFHLLSPETIYFSCKLVTLTKRIKFGEMLRKIPNVVNLELDKTSIIFRNTWPKDLLNVQNKLEILTITIDDINFDESILTNALMVKNMEIHLNIDIPVSYNYANTCKILSKKINQNFVQSTKCFSILRVFVAKNPGGKHELFGNFKLC